MVGGLCRISCMCPKQRNDNISITNQHSGYNGDHPVNKQLIPSTCRSVAGARSPPRSLTGFGTCRQFPTLHRLASILLSCACVCVWVWCARSVGVNWREHRTGSGRAVKALQKWTGNVSIITFLPLQRKHRVPATEWTRRSVGPRTSVPRVRALHSHALSAGNCLAC